MLFLFTQNLLYACQYTKQPTIILYFCKKNSSWHILSFNEIKDKLKNCFLEIYDQLAALHNSDLHNLGLKYLCVDESLLKKMDAVCK